MDPRAEALYLESNEYVGGDHPLGRITRAEAEATVMSLDQSTPGWDEALFVQAHPAAPEFGESGLSVNPQVLLDVFAPALIALYPNRSHARQVLEAERLYVPPVTACSSSHQHELHEASTKPKQVFDVLRAAVKRWMGD